MTLENLLKKFIVSVIAEEEDKKDNLLGEPDLSKEDDRMDGEEPPQDEQNVAANVAGYTLPLGASNSASSLKKRGEIAGQAFGGAKQAKKKKKSTGKPDQDWYK